MALVFVDLGLAVYFSLCFCFVCSLLVEFFWIEYYGVLRLGVCLLWVVLLLNCVLGVYFLLHCCGCVVGCLFVV